VKLIPVIDLKQGIVVHARGGKRHEYQPLQSRLTNSCSPREVAFALRRATDSPSLYVADLDAIGGAQPSSDIFEELLEDGFELWVDAGIRVADDAEKLSSRGVSKIIVGSETLQNLDELDRLIDEHGRSRIVFSLDLKQGVPITPLGVRRPFDFACEVIERGVKQMILLDLVQVGSNGGIGTEALCSQLISEMPSLELFAGGGIRSRADLDALENIGLKGALLSTSLHNGVRFLSPEKAVIDR
jgi:phosphoribosylformimino-5-aminoimidazole carboxamide ribotide isomerase